MHHRIGGHALPRQHECERGDDDEPAADALDRSELAERLAAHIALDK